MRTVIIRTPFTGVPDVALNIPNDWDLEMEQRLYWKSSTEQTFAQWLMGRGAVEATDVEIFEDS
jgi:hypothetical protein